MPLDFGEIMSNILRGETIDFSMFRFPEIVKRSIKRGFHHIEITLDLNYVVPGSLNENIIDELGKMRDEEKRIYPLSTIL